MYLLDTCVVSELWKSNSGSPVPAWLSAQDPELIYISVVTVGEIQKGISKLPASHKKQHIASWFQNDFMKRFAGQMFSFDERAALEWGRLAGELESKGRKMPVLDSLIASIAIVNAATLVTRNESDFQETGVQILNPWSI
jgi:tRNA(fMet)-specific endonuclease VapC